LGLSVKERGQSGQENCGVPKCLHRFVHTSPVFYRGRPASAKGACKVGAWLPDGTSVSHLVVAGVSPNRRTSAPPRWMFTTRLTAAFIK
jgi:hypothetical protein